MKSAALESLRVRSVAKSLASLLMLGLFVALQVIGSSAGLHEKVHCDAKSPDHQCAISLVSGGLISQEPPQIHVARPLDYFFVTFVHIAAPLLARDYRISIGRGPPSLL